MRRILPVILLLAACDNPSVAVQGVPAVKVAAGDHVFLVRVRDSYAEAVRVNPAWPPPKPAEIVPLAIGAMEQLSGCKVRMATVEGDAAIQKARLSC